MAEIEKIPEVIHEGMRLGRHIDHEAQRRARPFARRGAVPVVSVSHVREIPILDQGQVGSCTANAAVGAVGTTPLYQTLPATHPVLDESEALVLYSAEEVYLGCGPYPPNDDGGTGEAIATVTQQAGLISGFNHYLTLDDMLQALMEYPVIVGVNWYEGMFTPSATGVVTISGALAGGHEIECYGVNTVSEMLLFDNSWGTSWGINGTFSMSYATMTTLFDQQGDCTELLPLGITPPPTPTMVTIPNYYGHSVSYVQNALTALGLVPVTTSRARARQRRRWPRSMRMSRKCRAWPRRRRMAWLNATAPMPRPAATSSCISSPTWSTPMFGMSC